MSKNLLQDMVVTKSPKSGISPEPKKKFWDSLQKAKENKINPEEKLPEEPNYKSYESVDYGERRPKYSLWLVALFAVIMLLLALSFVFSKANIIINPKTVPLSLNETLSAVKENNSENLTFDLVVISGEETKTVLSTLEKDSSEPAKGSVVIYNNFSSAVQPLAIDTRLEGSNGKIYKTETKLTVPGKNPDGTPGSIEVKIYASEPGEDYNSTPLDFKIVGFKGTNKYDKFYARSKGEIKGGYTGRFFTVSEEEKSKYLLELKNSLEAKLFKKAIDQIPEGFLVFKDAVSLTVESEATDFMSKDSSITANMKGTLYGFLISEDKLTRKIAENKIPGYDGSPVHIPNIENLNFSILNKDTISFKDVKNITLRLSGESNLVWDVDTAKITEQVVGRKKKDFYQILSQYPNINSAELSLKPVWKRSFPDNQDKINIVVKEP